MKRNNVAKKLGIASLCLATAISAFSGISSFKNDSVVLAEEATTGFVETSASVSRDTSGLRISSDDAYEATFNRVFQGDTEFQFTFPETTDSASDFYGNFKFRIADATNESNYFDVIYRNTRTGSASKTGNYWTTAYLQWGDQIRTSSTATSTKSQSWYNSVPNYSSSANWSRSYLPHLLSKGARTTRTGVLSFTWTSTGVLVIQANIATTSGEREMATMAKFDGTYDELVSKNGFVSGTAKTDNGLPMLSFPNGYIVTVSSYMDIAEADRKPATDVLFKTIVSNGTTYSLVDDEQSNLFKSDNYAKAYDLIDANAGKALLGWKDAENALHSTDTALASADISAYTPVFLGFNRISGASVRIDTVDGNSGLRFITGFNPDEYALAKDYITSFGTLVAYTDSLTEGLFDVANYATQLAATENIKVLQQPNTKGTFEYEHQGVTYTAYSVALVGLTNFTQSYSARGYIEVAYADGTTATIYTLFNETDNSRSIAQTAYNLKTIGAAEYNTYSDAQKAIVDTYAAPLETAE